MEAAAGTLGSDPGGGLASFLLGILLLSRATCGKVLYAMLCLWKGRIRLEKGLWSLLAPLSRLSSKRLAACKQKTSVAGANGLESRQTRTALVSNNERRTVSYVCLPGADQVRQNSTSLAGNLA